mmetsp:Transcript_1566/g.3193  ORF Transcript_1566/g.3193 Transcript_1566/m.3193 type:complete len:363 (-) Transcript_1566:116-1204(-)
MTSPRRSRPTSPIRANVVPNSRDTFNATCTIKVLFIFIVAAYCVGDFVVDVMGSRSLGEEDGLSLPTEPLFQGKGDAAEISSSTTTTGGAPAKDLLLFETTIKQKGNWSETEIVWYMDQHPQRNYFSHLFAYGGFRRGIEIGVQDGRFSEIFMEQNSKLMRKKDDRWTWTMVDPNLTKYLNRRLGRAGKNSKWERSGYLENCDVSLQKTVSTDPALLETYPDGYFDFVYLDASHTYDAVKAELPLWWRKVKSGGIISGHDYCNYGEAGQSCNGCKVIPQCRDYTEWGVESAVHKSGRSANQNGVVKAVQDWMMMQESLGDDSSLTLRHTIENFTRESLARDGFDFDMVIRRDRNPSWYIYKP